MHKLIYLPVFAVLITILSFSIPESHATNYVLTQTMCISSLGGSWNSVTNTCTVSALTLNSGDVLAINSGTTLSVTTSFTNSGNVTLNTGNLAISGTMSNSGNVTNNGGAITNSGTLTNSANAIINNNAAGTIINLGSGTINNSGSISNNPSSTVTNSGTINNNSTGVINNNLATLTNTGSISNTGTIFNNDGTISSSGTLSNNLGALVSNNSGGTITNTGTMTNSGTIKNNSGIIDNFHSFINNPTGLVNNPATINDECNATFTNNGKLTGNAVQNICVPPTETPNVSGTLGNNGWYTSDVSITWTVTAPIPITSQTGCGPTTINADTTGQTMTCSATDANSTTSQSVTIKRDATAPSTAVNSATDGTSNPVTNGGKTNSTSISIAFTATDATSGVAGSTCNIDGGAFSACSSPVSYSSLADGSHTVQIRSTDNAGNLESTATFTWTVDTATPVANAQSISTNINTAAPVTLTGSDPDGDSLTYSVNLPPAHGVLSGTAPNLTYTPNANYHGHDSFTFITTDGINPSAPATVSITVADKTTTTVQPNPSTVSLSNSITFHVKIADTASSPTIPTGTVSWSDGGAGGHFSSSSCSLKTSSSSTSACTITYTPSSSTGTVTITGTYSGDTTHLTSSGTSTLKVTLRQTSILVTPNPSTVVHRQTITYLVNVTDSSTGTKTAPTGTVTWKASITGGKFSSVTCTLVPKSSSQSSCQVTYTAPLTTGSVTITSTYSGDSIHARSSGTSKLTVT